jgi:hypothetical protein
MIYNNSEGSSRSEPSPHHVIVMAQAIKIPFCSRSNNRSYDKVRWILNMLSDRTEICYHLSDEESQDYQVIASGIDGSYKRVL